MTPFLMQKICFVVLNALYCHSECPFTVILNTFTVILSAAKNLSVFT